MKKRLSLLVAVLMMLTLVPASAFAVEPKYSGVTTVDGSVDEPANFSAEFNVQSVDILKNGTVSVQLLGDDVEFAELNITTATAANPTPGAQPQPDAKKETYYLFNINAKDINLTKLVVGGEVKLDNADPGEYKIVYDLTGIGLGRHERVYAKVPEKTGSFTRITNSVKKVFRGAHETGSFEVKGKVDDEITIELPSTDFEWDQNNMKQPTTSVQQGKDLEFVPGSNNRKVRFTMTADKAVVTPRIVITKDSAKGDIELEVKRKRGSTTDIDTIKVAEYLDYGVVMELKKALQEKLANTDAYKVEVEVKTTDKDKLPKYLDFSIDGADVHVSSNDAKLSGDAAGQKNGNDKYGDNFEIVDADTDKVKLSFMVKPSWDASGDVVLKAKGRGMEELSLVILKVKPVAEMKVETKEVLGGDSKVAVADIVITETEAGALKSGKMFGVTLKGLKFAEDVKFDVKGKIEAEGIAVKDYTLDKDDHTLHFTIQTRSKKDAPGKITLKDVEVVSSRALPFGTHKLTFVNIDGESEDDKYKADQNYVRNARGAIFMVTRDAEFKMYEINKADFIKVVDKMSKVKKTTVFTLGSADYTVDGVAMKLDTPVFTQDNYTMLPVRAIADALGVDVVWNQENLTATFIDGDIVVSVTQDAKTLYKNGNSYPMVTKATVKSDRMFIPVSSVGDAFGLTRDYDYLYNKTSKEVTIYPKAMPAAAEEVKAEEVKAEEVK